MRILLTGSSGWLGKHLAPRLVSQGHVVVGMDVVPGEHTNIIASVADKDAVDSAFKIHSIEAVIHCGSLHKPDIASFPAQTFIDVNVTGTLNLLEAAVAAGHDRFVYTSTTSLMISEDIREESSANAIWLDECYGPLAPRNIYDVTKLAAENLCRIKFFENKLNCVVIRTGRFFPKDDDTHCSPSGDNLKANEFLNRRLTVEDAADAHVVALNRAPLLGYEIFILSAYTPFTRADAAELKSDVKAVIQRYFPDAVSLYAKRNWELPTSIGRVYDASKAERLLGFRCKTDFSAVLEALRSDAKLPFAHDPTYISPTQALAK